MSLNQVRKYLKGGAAAVFLTSVLTGSSFAEDPSEVTPPTPATMTVGQYMSYSKEQSRVVANYVVNVLEVYISKLAGKQDKTPEEAEHHKNLNIFLSKLIHDKGPLLDELNNVIIGIHKQAGGDDVDVADVVAGFIDEKVPNPAETGKTNPKEKP
jgi:hypothetical protein